ncbi:sensor domain-containing diguanylate cyclase [Paenibacillus sp. TRM 82003]|uniref:sensor domain-containing diguanylate cyclase n=1 Tax=Kineococcus sp. TRM81007 TaxID=2925831 RepID=UPI001F595037|nr:sensor domain-containing diguanylate cyclase [Kineococcus sp. TRM81007]MCI2239621.1 sensor domain-containing diguanylate cyclase [Kineococcus sp. TRM81007]MCI3926097.1 sensor domain-containing diguanylate cyclase [Paenibacillus sp. TRM 82003]
MDPQDALPVQLVQLAQQEGAPLQRTLDLVHTALARRSGVLRAEVLAHEGGDLVVVARAGEPGPVAGACAVFPLRHGGAELGLLHLHGGDPSAVDPVVGAAAGHHLAVALRDVAAAREQAELHRVTDAVRRLFEEGARAGSVEAAGRLLVAVTADVLGTERAAVMLVDPDTRVTHVLGVGLPEGLEQRLAAGLLGRLARDSPAWWRAVSAGGPELVDDVAVVPVRPGGFVQTLGVCSYVSLPLMSAEGLVGTAVCGDVTRRRTWTAADRVLAHRIALQGAVVVDNARLRELERAHLHQLEHRAFHDQLTGLPNRAALLGALGDALDPVTGDGRVALLLIDLDGFKRVNDTLGHHAGDVLLQQVAARLLALLPAGATAARLGGDELAVTLTGPVREDAAGLARAVHERLGEPYGIEGRTVRTGASIGIAHAPRHATDVTGLLRAADEAMYRAKRAGTGPHVARDRRDPGPAAPAPDRDVPS